MLYIVLLLKPVILTILGKFGSGVIVIPEAIADSPNTKTLFLSISSPAATVIVYSPELLLVWFSITPDL